MPTLSALPPSTAVSSARRRQPDKSARGQGSSRFAHYLTRPILRLGPLAFSSAVIATLVFAWIERDEGHITAEKGVGYWLGIAGAVIMLTLVLYPLRKRFKILHGVGRVSNWFRLHMLLGILGPTLVILHTNFRLGSLNSRLALFTMLIVVASGIIGRYLYAKVHKGLYGRQIELRDIIDDITALENGIGASVTGAQDITNELAQYRRQASSVPSTMSLLTSAALTTARTQASRRRILRNAKRHMLADPRPPSRRDRRQRLSQIDRHLKLYFAAVKKAERLAFFERLFGMWHHLHVPLFILLTLTVVLHVVAVHLY